MMMVVVVMVLVMVLVLLVVVLVVILVVVVVVVVVVIVVLVVMVPPKGNFWGHSRTCSNSAKIRQAIQKQTREDWRLIRHCGMQSWLGTVACSSGWTDTHTHTHTDAEHHNTLSAH